jgi:hypothetical protein
MQNDYGNIICRSNLQKTNFIPSTSSRNEDNDNITKIVTMKQPNFIFPEQIQSYPLEKTSVTLRIQKSN